jgi:hypothetical protein
MSAFLSMLYAPIVMALTVVVVVLWTKTINIGIKANLVATSKTKPKTGMPNDLLNGINSMAIMAEIKTLSDLRIQTKRYLKMIVTLVQTHGEQQ